MGGSGGGGGSWGGSTGGTWGDGGAGGATGGAGGGSGAALGCPVSFNATLIGPAAVAWTAGEILDVTLISSPAPGRAVCVHRATGVTVGAIGGIPGLAKLLECLQAGVGYEARIDTILGGKIDVTVSQV